MIDPGGHSPRRYLADKNGRRVLVGLTLEETLEFETLDSVLALEESRRHVVRDRDGVAAATRQKRWLELYDRHDQSWQQWMFETSEHRRVEALERIPTTGWSHRA
jgi:hypothetical protein